MSSPVSYGARKDNKGSKMVRPQRVHLLTSLLTPVGKQTTVRISRAEQTPANQTPVRLNLEPSWHKEGETTTTTGRSLGAQA